MSKSKTLRTTKHYRVYEVGNSLRAKGIHPATETYRNGYVTLENSQRSYILNVCSDSMLDSELALIGG